MVKKKTGFPTSVEGHILSPDVRPGNNERYVSECDISYVYIWVMVVFKYGGQAPAFKRK